MEKGKDVFIADTARVMGKVTLKDKVSIWYGAVVRGDADQITIEEGSNVQDVAVVHVDPGYPTHIGKMVTVGHAAIVHGATIGDYTLVGMRATVMNGAKIGKHCVIGAHALVTENKEIPDYSLVIGSPGKVVKTFTPEEAERFQSNAVHYIENAKQHAAGQYPAE